MSYIVKITALDRKDTYLDCVGCAVSRRQAFEFSSREDAEDSLCMFTEPEEKARIVRICDSSNSQLTSHPSKSYHRAVFTQQGK